MNMMATESTQGQRIRVEGQVFDGDGAVIPDVMVEIWQANAYGRYNHPDDKQEKPLDSTFTGWAARAPMKKVFIALKPSSRDPCREQTITCKRRTSTLQSSRAACWCTRIRAFISATGGQRRRSGIEFDQKQKAPRETLIALPGMEDDKTVYRFDIRLQGDNETVFFDM